MIKQISIIIPTYNMEQYLASCLDSLLIPELDLVEVLVVNDGSKDKSLLIATDYQKKYPQSIRVIDKPNGNYGSCINAALPIAKGRYIKILDADDSFDSFEFSKFVRQLPEINDDLLISSFRKVDSAGNELEHSDVLSYGIEPDISISDSNAFMKKLCHYVPMHRVTYNHDVFRRFTYKQSEGISYTDVQWATIPMAFCHSVRFMNLTIYNYLVGREGQTMNPVQMAKSLGNLFSVADGLVDYNLIPSDAFTKKYLFIRTTDFHKSFYFEVLRHTHNGSMKLLREYECKLKIKSPEIYDAIAQIAWDENSAFRIFNDIRKKGYPDNYKIPIWPRIKLRTTLIMKRIFSF